AQPGGHALPACDRPQLPGKLRRARARAQDLSQVGAALVVLGKCVEQQVCVTANAGDQVVEVVGDTACEAAHGLESLALCESSLQSYPVVNVANHCKVTGLAVQLYHSCGEDRLSLAAIGAAQQVRELAQHSLGGERVQGDIAFLQRAPYSEFGNRLADQRIASLLHHSTVGAVDLEHDAVRCTRDHHAVRYQVEQLLEGVLCAAKLVEVSGVDATLQPRLDQPRQQADQDDPDACHGPVG